MSEAEQIRELKAKAKEHFEAIKGAEVMRSKVSMVIGYHAYRMKVENLFQVMGFENEDAARKAAGVGESTWYAMIRLAEDFKDLPEKKFLSMKQANAKALADLPESKRTSSEWVRMAGVDKIEEFEAKVDHELNGKARASDSKERSTVMKLDMPASRKAVIEESVKVFAEAHGLEASDTGKVFEVMCLETTQGDTLIGAITTALQRVKAMQEIIRGPFSSDEALGKINVELGEMVLEFQAALQQAAKEEDDAAA